MFKLFVVILFLTSCTVSSSSQNPLKNLNDKFPFFDIHLDRFVVFDQDSNASGATSIDNQNAKILTVSEKRIMLNALDTIRFVINTPEFGSLMKLQTYYAADNFSGPNGMVQKGQPYPSKERLLQVIQQRMASVIIRKEQVPLVAFAVGQLPIESGRFFNAYVASDDNPINHGTFFVAFNNREKWDSPPFFQNEAFIASVLFHELLHNMGFSHAEPLDINRDTVYVLQQVLEAVYNDPAWQNKYAGALRSFRPFYPNLYSSWLKSDTLPENAFFRHEHNHSQNVISEEQLLHSFELTQTFHSLHGKKIKCVYDEKTKSYIVQVL